MYRLLTASIGIVAVALLALGCGSSSDAGETVEALTKAQFIKQADQGCAEVAKKREAAAAAWREKHPDDLAPSDLREALQEVVAPAVREQVEVLEAIDAPATDTAVVARMVDNLNKAGADFEKKGSEGPEASQFQAEARKYGLKICPRLY